MNPLLWSTLVVKRQVQDLTRIVSQVELRVELRGLEPLTPCLQSDVFIRVSGLDLRDRLSLSDRHVPLWPGGNGTLMARDLGLGGRKDFWP
jgi:hypothetical protein